MVGVAFVLVVLVLVSGWCGDVGEVGVGASVDIRVGSVGGWR